MDRKWGWLRNPVVGADIQKSSIVLDPIYEALMRNTTFAFSDLRALTPSSQQFLEYPGGI